MAFLFFPVFTFIYSYFINCRFTWMHLDFWTICCLSAFGSSTELKSGLITDDFYFCLIVFEFDCFVQGVIGGVILTVTVNDMGNYGRNANYVDKVSLPLFAEAVINIIKRRPISSVAAHCEYIIEKANLIHLFPLKF